MNDNARPDVKLFLVSDFGGICNPDKLGCAAFGMVTKEIDVVLKIQKLKDNEQYLEKPVGIIGITRIKLALL